MGYEPGDLGIVPRPHSRLPTRRDGMRRLIVAQRKQAHALIDELSKKPTDPTTTSTVRVSTHLLYNNDNNNNNKKKKKKKKIYNAHNAHSHESEARAVTRRFVKYRK